MASKRVNKKIGQGRQANSAGGHRAVQPAAENADRAAYFFSMSNAPRIDRDIHWFQLLPLAFFAAIVIVITRMYSYTRPMEDFYWTSGNSSLSDFFSYYKMVAILVCAAIAIVLLLYRVFTQSLAIKKSSLYVPMALYTLLVLLSYLFSDYKEFSLLGWNDRFEGTLVLLAYMVMLFYAINTINTERAVKWIVYPLAAVSALLSLLGLSQALDRDFFRTTLGQKLLVPNAMTENGTTWDLIDQAAAQGQQYLKFTFQNNEIYQTVYNINYVSFYLTLLIPLFGLLFIRSCMRGKEEALWKKILWGVLFALLIYNLIGSASSGGFLGMFFVVLFALILLNKRILQWWKPVVVLLAITVLMAGATYERWVPELTNAINSASAPKSGDVIPGDGEAKGYLDYLVTEGDDIIVGYNGEELTLTTYPEEPGKLVLTDKDGEKLSLKQVDGQSSLQVDDARFSGITTSLAADEQGRILLLIGTDGKEWTFYPNAQAGGVQYVNAFGKLIELEQVPAVGWENKQDFGSGRGYIWSRTIPMLKDTLLLGHGADTYCIYFPHKDYAGKYNTNTFGGNVNIIVDKPHNMFLGMAVGTGLVSVIAFLAIVALYAAQTFRVFWRRKYERFIDYAGAGIFFGVMGFVITGWVNDSTVSVMPMFYGLLGTGVAINLLLRRQTPVKAA